MSTATAETEILSGELEHVMTVAKRRTGKRPHPSTVWRWCKKGVRGGSIKLAAIFSGGYWQTTDAAFNKFLQDQTDAAFSQGDGGVSDAELRSAGLM
ncbi:DUF1580 domain-containing protein [uncultured Rubinisphaera sp.]|uniref:DUF1580 domain-containing protein n=1 Tax=uncultured Rubinisphaera sp. TaxID=1678686 RepID=UPI0030D9CED0|tara:strand:- start:155 stop:445 length:291 start_codon:yes stop_codon:yes gene_type:complete